LLENPPLELVPLFRRDLAGYRKRDVPQLTLRAVMNQQEVPETAGGLAAHGCDLAPL